MISPSYYVYPDDLSRRDSILQLIPNNCLKQQLHGKREVSNIQPHAKKITYELYWDADYLKIVSELLLPVRFTKWLSQFML